MEEDAALSKAEELLQRIGLADREPVRTALDVQARASDDGVGPLAAALAYYAFLSLFPLLLLALSAAGFLLGDEEARRTLMDRVTETIPGLQEFTDRNLTALIEGRAEVGLAGLLGAVWTGSGVARGADFALGRIFRVEILSAVRQRARSVATALALGALALVSIAIPAAITGLVGVELWARLLASGAGLLFDVGFFLVTYWALTPRRARPIRLHVPGAIGMAIGWTALKYAGSLYATRTVARATALYGTVGAVIGLLLILHLAARFFLYGAELSAVRAERRRHGPLEPIGAPPRPD